MYKLILILTFVANGASVEVEEMEFDDKSACQTALIEILRSYEQEPVLDSRLHVDGVCVPKSDD